MVRTSRGILPPLRLHTIPIPGQGEWVQIARGRKSVEVLSPEAADQLGQDLIKLAASITATTPTSREPLRRIDYPPGQRRPECAGGAR